MSGVETAARAKLQRALSSLREAAASASTPQRVLSSVVEIEGLLVASEPRPDVLQRLVTTCLAPSLVVRELLLDVTTSYERHEEIVGCVCRIVEIACRVSRRFQGEIGLLGWCRVLHSVRSRHSESPRVLLATLRCQVALLSNCELLQLQTTQSFPALVDEMLELIDRFAASAAGREREIAPHFDRSAIVLESLRVLSELFGSVRVTVSCPAIASRASDGILERLQRCREICVAAGRDAVRLWLRTVRSQLQTQPRASLHALTASSSGLAALLRSYSDDVDVICDVCGLLSVIFPVPNGPSSRVCRDAMPTSEVDARAPEFAIDSALIEALCECFAALGASQRKDQVAQLDVARVLRQLSAVPSIASLVPTVATVKTTLVPSLVLEIRQSAVDAVARRHDAVDQELRRLLELLLLLKQLLSLSALAKVWSHNGVSDLQLVLGKLQKRVSAFAIKSNATDSSALSLVNEALKDVLPLCRSVDVALSSSSSTSTAATRKPQSSAEGTTKRLARGTSSKSELLMKTTNAMVRRASSRTAINTTAL